MSNIEKNWLTQYRWTGDETALPIKAEALKAASEYTIELEQQNARLRERWEKLKRYISDESYDGDAAFNGGSIHIDRLRKWMKNLEAL